VSNVSTRVGASAATSRVAADSRLYNEDLAPVPPEKRTWRTINYLTLWVGMSSQIPTYLVAGGLIALGMNWWQAIFTVALGNALILIPILLNSHVGAKYGIPFPVFVRASYGVFGANLPALMRAAVACGWFGIQCWIGGTAINLAIAAVIPGWNDFGGTVGGNPIGMWLAFLIFWALNIFIIWRGMEALRRFQTYAAPIVLAFGLGLTIWMLSEANGFGPVFSDPGKLNSLGEFMPVFIPALVGVMALWATLSLNVPDFTRFAINQRAQLIGQAIALPLAMTLFAAIGAILASASKVVYGTAIWDPVKLAGHIGSPALKLTALLAAAVVTLTVNLSANVVSPSYDFANVAPRHISRRTGGMLVGFIGIASQPWSLLSSPSGFIFDWLGGYGAGMGAIAGVMIVDYWIIRRRQLSVRDLFSENGVYRYTGGWNVRAIVATVLGLLLAWGGYAISAIHGLTDYGWFVGFFVSGIAYLGLARLGLAVPRPRGAAARGGA
jgi:NCS1 family nucleobase:cation symporter-1